MPENTIEQPENSSSELKSFKLYAGKKAPLVVQIVAGIIWLGAAGLLLQGILGLLLSPILGVITLAIGAFAIITGKSLFGMKKNAVRNSLIMGTFLTASVIWRLIATKFEGGLTENSAEVFTVLFAMFLVSTVFRYKNLFTN
ncbi:MAG: hypothetical protein Q8P01_05095 [bacterium]|nr:hypothetical protein [bacterium]